MYILADVRSVMSCDINNNPCDECTEPYCPDQLEDVHNKYNELVSRIAHLEDKLVGAKISLAAHKLAHKDVLNPWRQTK